MQGVYEESGLVRREYVAHVGDVVRAGARHAWDVLQLQASVHSPSRAVPFQRRLVPSRFHGSGPIPHLTQDSR
jgi:hypothetical protein